ncbi:MAG: hypothetical protein HQL31_11910, partial [Planctomycetes bacterium]|nr:hypothetical protein [Planctomycetota bacterium]
MRVEALAIGDEFVPLPRPGVLSQEVHSQGRPRTYVLYLPEGTAMDTVAVKDHFLWECMDGKKSLGALKQDYYAKFKSLPTAHLTDLTRRWLRLGFLEKSAATEEVAELVRRRSLLPSVRLPLHFPKLLLAPLAAPLSSKIGVGLVALLAVLGYLLSAVLPAADGGWRGLFAAGKSPLLLFFCVL